MPDISLILTFSQREKGPPRPLGEGWGEGWIFRKLQRYRPDLMLIRIPELLGAEQVIQARQILDKAEWIDGRVTAGHQSTQAKDNMQIAEGSPPWCEIGRANRPGSRANRGADGGCSVLALPKKWFRKTSNISLILTFSQREQGPPLPLGEGWGEGCIFRKL